MVNNCAMGVKRETVECDVIYVVYRLNVSDPMGVELLDMNRHMSNGPLLLPYMVKLLSWVDCHPQEGTLHRVIQPCAGIGANWEIREIMHPLVVGV